MLRIQVIGLAIVAALAMSALAAGTASAETELHQWLLIHDQPNGEQIHLLLAAPITVHSEGLVLLEDEKAPGGPVEVHCHGFDAGTVGPHGLDLVESITTELLKGSNKIPCNFVKNGSCLTSTTPTAEALHLPWHTELVLIGGVVHDLILSDGAGIPGWAVTCNTILGSMTDKCEEEPGEPNSTVMSNVLGEGVLGKFEPAAGIRAKCSIGGAKAGKVTGTVLTQNPSSTLLLAISFGP